MDDLRQLLESVLDQHADAYKWIDARFEKIRRIPNTKVGDVGQDFIEALCEQCSFTTAFPEKTDGKRSKQSPWDIEIGGIKFELKTASEDVKKRFQFDHIRYARDYQALLCLGISPSDIFFNVWSKADVATGKSGKLVSMEKSGSASYKLTKRLVDLKSIDDFEATMREFITNFV
jgi:hypothetical protein